MVTHKASTHLQACLASTRMSGPNGESEEQQDANQVWTTWNAAEETRIQTSNQQCGTDGWMVWIMWQVLTGSYDSNKKTPTPVLPVEFIVPSIPSSW
jgi:hypothetical protein